jgi:hypothetical protein
MVEEISGEFGDGGHVPSNISQAARLWQASGRSEQGFVQLMYEARSITLEQVRTSGQARRSGGRRQIKNRMAYFFSVLKDVLEDHDVSIDR